MSTHSERTRIAVRCENCGAILVAEIERDGSVRPLVPSVNCICGDGAFT
ncbi:hypothetical protein C486_12745 [Natrinema gari JCM 14663]|uniref:Uncharacterized protein n=1 Tax=Natrinema gari JCM 14663 TaxID=1230459 RepID=L9YXJ4_9EURY|nr:hypothetical protein C486_12745 [Natrinema gari JCM 14663]